MSEKSVTGTLEDAAWLRTPAAIRTQCRHIYDYVKNGESRWFTLDEQRLEPAARFVLEVIRDNYPDLHIPYHSRFRHFSVGGVDRVALVTTAAKMQDPHARARSLIELVITSVLLDAGAGMGWRYQDRRSGSTWSKSEGLAVASFEMFLAGAFSSDRQNPLQADPDGLSSLSAETLRSGFQVTRENPLEGFDGRLHLIHRLGDAVRSGVKYFGSTHPRLGGLYDYLKSQASGASLPAAKILAAVLDSLSVIWPGRLTMAGVNLGDVWSHAALPAGRGAGLVPFHKLSQWLSYSIIEPMEGAGFSVTGMDELTGLAEYRNGGLFVDTGVLNLRDAAIARTPLAPDHEAIIEWRAMTVCLLDMTADLIRKFLQMTPQSLPLARVLEGGTWAAGRRVAARLRSDGGPPLRLASDGTVF